MQPVNALLIENQSLVRLGIKTLLASADDITLIGEAPTPDDGFRQFSEMRPDVTILGLRFPDSCSIDDLDKYFAEWSEAKIIVLADHAGDSEITKALRKGPSVTFARTLLRLIFLTPSGPSVVDANIFRPILPAS
ncbi:MAG: hypothetical protein ABR530_00175 [Pyrinomonadaceae bacterium]